MPQRRRLLALAVVVAVSVVAGIAQDLQLPLKPNSIRFLVMGDTGTGDSEQYETAAQILKWRQKFPFTFALMLGDNLYGSERPQDFVKKFERPYQALLDDKVEFNAALGNHDDPNQIYYKPFNLDGKRYRTFKKGDVRFFVLDSNYLDPEQLKWFEKELEGAGSDWKIAYFHHPMYTSATRGPVIELRAALEPLFVKYDVDVVFSWARALVRTDLAAEGDLLFHGRRLGEAPRRRHHEDVVDGDGLRHRQVVHAGRNRRRRAVLPDNQPERRDDRQRHPRTPQGANRPLAGSQPRDARPPVVSGFRRTMFYACVGPCGRLIA